MKPQPVVAIAHTANPYQATAHALSLLPPLAVEPGDKVVIKPNMVRPKPPESGVTTDARVVEAIIDHLQGLGVREITVAEGGNPGTDKAFKVTGLREVVERHGVGLVNLNKDRGVEVEVKGGWALDRVVIAETVLECDKLVNVPKLKIHHMAQVTLSIKNLMGCLVGNRGLTMHHRLDEKLVDLATLFKPVVNVVDGIVGSEMDEVVGQPVRSNIVIAGTDMVAVDAVGAAAMGLDPAQVRHIQLAARRGLGQGDLEKIKVVGASLGEVAKPYSTRFSDEKLKTYGLSHPLTPEDLEYMRRSFTGRDPAVKDPYAE